jgi:hypothetical protein
MDTLEFCRLGKVVEVLFESSLKSWGNVFPVVKLVGTITEKEEYIG